MRAKKSFGQHFLVNVSLAENIVKTAQDVGGEMPILEIGPGKGALTKLLIERKMDFIAVDSDREMVEYLKDNFKPHADKFVCADFLKFDLNSVFAGKPLFVLGNFPYSISSQILVKVIQNRDRIPFVIGMFQKEMADRIVSPSGNKTYSRLTVLLQAFYSARIFQKVSAGSFRPPPKVASALILFKRHQIELGCDEKLFRQIVSLSFGQRRKMLKNTLAGLVSRQELRNSPLFKNRPENLTVQDFVHLTNLIAHEIDGNNK